MNDRHHFTMRTTREGLTEIIGRVNALLEPEEFAARAMYVVNLILEEILTNIVKYGSDDEGVQDVDVRLMLGPEEICIEFEDSGREFDPLSIPPPPPDESLLDLEPGGRGIHLVRTMADSVRYRRQRDRNVLTVTVKNRDT